MLPFSWATFYVNVVLFFTHCVSGCALTGRLWDCCPHIRTIIGARFAQRRHHCLRSIHTITASTSWCLNFNRLPFCRYLNNCHPAYERLDHAVISCSDIYLFVQMKLDRNKRFANFNADQGTNHFFTHDNLPL